MFLCICQYFLDSYTTMYLVLCLVLYDIHASQLTVFCSIRFVIACEFGIVCVSAAQCCVQLSWQYCWSCWPHWSPATPVVCTPLTRPCRWAASLISGRDGSVENINWTDLNTLNVFEYTRLDFGPWFFLYFSVRFTFVCFIVVIINITLLFIPICYQLIYVTTGELWHCNCISFLCF